MDTRKIAERVVEEGHSYYYFTFNEGSPSSGPYSLMYVGVRWGRARVELSPNGNVYLMIRPHRYCWRTQDKYWLIYRSTPSFMTDLKDAWRQNIRIHLDDLAWIFRTKTGRQHSALFYSTVDAAALLGVSKSTARRWARSGRLEAVKFNRQWRYNTKSVNKEALHAAS
jgi:excisionase family DNA binding protein